MVEMASIESGDSLSKGGGILIGFNEAVDLRSFGAVSIDTSTKIFFDDTAGNPQTQTILFQVYRIESATNVILDGLPLTFWYDPNSFVMALFEETTVTMPYGTGVGFRINQDSTELILNAHISSKNGVDLGEDFKLIINRARTPYQLRAVPNPIFPIVTNQDTLNPLLHFIDLPVTCKIRIYDQYSIEIKSIQHDSGGVEQWDLTYDYGASFEAGSYQFEIETSLTTIKRGIFVLPTSL
ncbi:MAG: hypothetical protein GWN00_26290 [Aliifodinibius sp.]|nr:hypothetical protein [Fodinibius sp.]NIV14363.1 hypothetical protein [Fodinibius sp.]NIY28182.1 hypothetical protein [Fodinibius sp.]